MKKFRGLYFPLMLIILYLVGSYALYRFGCYVWPFREDILTGVFVLLCTFSLGIGYVFSMRRNKIINYEDAFLSVNPEKVLIVSCIVSLILFIPICKTYTNSWYPPIIRTLTDLKGTYYELADVALGRTGIRIWGFLDVFSYVLLPLALWARDEVRKSVRYISVVIAIAYLLIYISSARNISVAIQMLSVLAVWLSTIFSPEKKGVVKTTILSTTYMLLVVVFFGMTMSDRTSYDENVYVALRESAELESPNTNVTSPESPDASSTEPGLPNTGIMDSDGKKEIEETLKVHALELFEEEAERYNREGVGQRIGIGEYNKNGLIIDEEQITNFSEVYAVFPNYTDVWSKGYVNINDVFVKGLPSSLSYLYTVGTTYITNGYNCLTIALHTPHKWTYGVGHSTFLSGYIDKFFGTDISSRTYYSRLSEDDEYPLVSKSLWPSTFVQWADDITFVGVIFYMMFIGYFIAKVWTSILLGKNYWGVLLLGQLMLGVLFLPANNILENSGGFFVTFWSLFLAWVMSQIQVKKGKSIEANKQ